jgi:large subunit ribosomal protein L4
MPTTTYTKTGTKATTPAKLDKAVFGVEVKNHELIKLSYLSYLANSRKNLAVTKTRGLIRGGGRKPWKQKGTGRARFGSSRNPIWRGGGIVFGPTGEENYKLSLNVKAKRQAIRQALSLADQDNKISVIEDLTSKEGKTNELAKLLIKINANKNVLMVVEKKSPEMIRASKNLGKATLVSAKYLNVYDVINSDQIVFTQEALKHTTEWLMPTSTGVSK